MKITEISEGGLKFGNGAMLTDYHKQDCCEYVYADWMNMKAMVDPSACGGKNELDLSQYNFFEDILSSVVPIYGLGFYLVTQQGVCLLVSCYDIQNGYYSSDLELIHTVRGETKGSLDITECTTIPDGYGV